MTDFNDFGNDQYVVDMQKTYPLFSDTQTNYLDVMSSPPAVRVTAPEQKMRMEQQRVPSYVYKYPCGDNNEKMTAGASASHHSFDLTRDEKIILLLVLIIIFICYSFNKTLHKILKHVRMIEAKLSC